MDLFVVQLRMRAFTQYKERVRQLRIQGNTYLEIVLNIKKPIPKSTLSNWCRDINTSPFYGQRIAERMLKGGELGREKSWRIRKQTRTAYLAEIKKRYKKYPEKLANKDFAKVVLAALYMAEGSKAKTRLTFGNSDPNIIKLFLKLLRKCFPITESKFRCTLQCREDQDINGLEHFWSLVTNIPFAQFYKARIDPRSKGKKSKKVDYKGVCRIDYFSAHMYNEIMTIADLLASA